MTVNTTIEECKIIVQRQAPDGSWNDVTAFPYVVGRIHHMSHRRSIAEAQANDHAHWQKKHCPNANFRIVTRAVTVLLEL